MFKIRQNFTANKMLSSNCYLTFCIAPYNRPKGVKLFLLLLWFCFKLSLKSYRNHIIYDLKRFLIIREIIFHTLCHRRSRFSLKQMLAIIRQIIYIGYTMSLRHNLTLTSVSTSFTQRLFISLYRILFALFIAIITIFL